VTRPGTGVGAREVCEGKGGENWEGKKVGKKKTWGGVSCGKARGLLVKESEGVGREGGKSGFWKGAGEVEMKRREGWQGGEEKGVVGSKTRRSTTPPTLRWKKRGEKEWEREEYYLMGPREDCITGPEPIGDR